MPEVREEKVYAALLGYKGEGRIKIGNTEVRVSLNPIDVHNIGRPDSILWVEVSLTLFGQNLKLRVPLPIEAEKNGIDDAIEDLDAFVERKRYPIEIPMVVVAEAGYDRREELRNLSAKFMISQVPVRRLKSTK